MCVPIACHTSPSLPSPLHTTTQQALPAAHLGAPNSRAGGACHKAKGRGRVRVACGGHGGQTVSCADHDACVGVQHSVAVVHVQGRIRVWQAQTSAFPAREQPAVLFYHECGRLGQPYAGRTEAVQHAAWCVMKCTATEGCLKAGGELRAKGHVAHVHALSSIVTAPIAHLLQHPYHHQPRCRPVSPSHIPTSEQTAALCPCR